MQKTTLQNPIHLFNRLSVLLLFMFSTILLQAQSTCYVQFVAQNGTLPNSVVFTSTASPSNLINATYTWDFGDNSSGTGQNPGHTYNAPGVYIVCVTMVGQVPPTGQLCTAQYCDSIVVGTPPPPPATCHATITYQNAGANKFYFSTAVGPAGFNPTSFAWNFGDGNTSSLQYPMHTYTSSGTYTVCLTVAGMLPGNVPCTTQACVTVVVNMPPPLQCYVTFTAQPGTANHSMMFNSAFGPTGLNVNAYSWTFGDGGTSNQANPVYVYNAPGTYVVCVTIQGTQASTGQTCTASYCDSIVVSAPPPPPTSCHASITFQNINANKFYFFVATGPTGFTPGSYAWNFGDGNTSTQQNPMHIYANSGTYVVCVTVIGMLPGSVACTTQACITVSVNIPPPLQCAVTFTAQPGTSGNSMMFTSTVSPQGLNVTSYHWNFGDNTTSSQANPVHVYNAAGTYVVCITIQGTLPATGQTCTKTYCDSVVVGTPPPPPGNCYVTFIAQPDSVPNSMQFNAVAGPFGLSNVTYSWTFGDGGSSTLSNPLHVYNTPGKYHVCVTITGLMPQTGVTCSATKCDTVQVGTTPPPNQCAATFAWQHGPSNPTTVSFTSTYSPSNAQVVSYAWSFGDNSTSSSANPVHTYNSPGVYQVCLTVVMQLPSGNLCTAHVCKTVTVGTTFIPCQAKFYYHKSQSGGANVIQFVNTSTGNPTSYLWNFGDGTTSTSPSPVHTYAAAGTYYVCLTISNPNASPACHSTFCDTIKVGHNTINAHPCVSKFSFYQLSSPSRTIRFINRSKGFALSYMWNFGDGTTSSAHSPIKQYAQPGTYFVCLTVTNTANNCYSVMCRTVNVANNMAIVDDFSQPEKLSVDAVEGIIIYPNPIQERAMVSLTTDELTDGTPVFRLYDLMGREVFSELMTDASSYEFIRGNLKDGIYIYRITGNTGMLASGKVILN
jgi:PKD repeat protein